MKKIVILSILSFLFAVTQTQAQCSKNCAKANNCTSKTEVSQNTEKEAINIFYFHATRRCATCMAVENVTTETLKDNFGTQIPFLSINREEDNENPLIEKYSVSGQTLLIVKGEKVINLTNDAFLYARTNPDKYKEKLLAVIENM